MPSRAVPSWSAASRLTIAGRSPASARRKTIADSPTSSVASTFLLLKAVGLAGEAGRADLDREAVTGQGPLVVTTFVGFGPSWPPPARCSCHDPMVRASLGQRLVARDQPRRNSRDASAAPLT